MPSACDAEPCHHHGTCHLTSSLQVFECFCPAGYAGKRLTVEPSVYGLPPRPEVPSEQKRRFAFPPKIGAVWQQGARLWMGAVKKGERNRRGLVFAFGRDFPTPAFRPTPSGLPYKPIPHPGCEGEALGESTATAPLPPSAWVPKVWPTKSLLRKSSLLGGQEFNLIRAHLSAQRQRK